MPRLPIAPSGPEFSRLVYGTWRLLDDGASAQDINRRLQRCLELGITTIDTAEIYGLYRVEELLGRALALTPGLRDRLELVTKAGIYIPHAGDPTRTVACYDASGARLKQSLETSLRLLGTDRVDLFLVHRPDWLTGIDDTAQGLTELRRTGLTRSVGVSNYSAAQFAALNSRLEQPLVTNQLEFHLLHMDPIHDGTFDQCQQLGVRPMAWSPLAGGRLFSPGNEAAVRLGRAAAALADKYDGATLEQLAYAWILAHPSRPLPVIGTNKVERIESAAKAAAIELSREDWFALWVAARGHGIP
ncbi:aldo/keto reductase [Lacunisphaera limnophila]|nr:aldo/keto reductase [Lacunisphaera limnophila]